MLHDIDKSNRGQPIVNSHDKINVLRMAHGTNSVNYVTGASPLSSIAGGKNGQFTIVESGLWAGGSLTTGNPGAGNFLSGSSIMATIPHNLGFIPSALAYYQVASSPLEYDLLPSTTMVFTGLQTVLWWTIWLLVDATNLYIQVNWMAYGTSFNITLSPVKWYLLQQVAN